MHSFYRGEHNEAGFYYVFHQYGGHSSDKRRMFRCRRIEVAIHLVNILNGGKGSLPVGSLFATDYEEIAS